MRPIKFRGRDINTGEVIFGDLRHIGIRTYIFKEAQCYYDEELIEVDEDSVAQLVGFDRDDKEVYEDDTLIDQNGREYTISDDIQVELFCGGVYEPLYSTRYKFKLKEG